MQLTTKLVHNGSAGTAPHNFFLPGCKKMKRQTADKSAWRQIARQTALKGFSRSWVSSKTGLEKRLLDNSDTVSKCPCGEKAQMHFVRFSTLSEPLLTTVPLNQGRINLGQSCNGFFWNTKKRNVFRGISNIFQISLAKKLIKERMTFEVKISIRIIILHDRSNGGIIN